MHCFISIKPILNRYIKSKQIHIIDKITTVQNKNSIESILNNILTIQLPQII